MPKRRNRRELADARLEERRAAYERDGRCTKRDLSDPRRLCGKRLPCPQHREPAQETA